MIALLIGDVACRGVVTPLTSTTKIFVVEVSGSHPLLKFTWRAFLQIRRVARKLNVRLRYKWTRAAILRTVHVPYLFLCHNRSIARELGVIVYSIQPSYCMTSVPL